MEHWEALRPGGLRFVWRDDLFRPGTDTFLLSAFPRLKKGERAVDLGSGTGLLSLLLLQREPGLTVTGIEILPEAAALMARCAAENRIGDRMTPVCLDLRRAAERFSPGSFDLAVSNPPYFAAGSGAEPPGQARRAARSESACTLEELFHAAAYLLRYGGRFCLIHRPERIADLLCTARESGCEVKRLRFVKRRGEASPSLLLAEARRGGRPGVSIEPDLLLQNPDGSPTEELDRIYFREREGLP